MGGATAAGMASGGPGAGDFKIKLQAFAATHSPECHRGRIAAKPPFHPTVKNFPPTGWKAVEFGEIAKN
jgi:hypothetical protein